MGKDLLYLLCASVLSERECYRAFAETRSADELESAVGARFSADDVRQAAASLKKMRASDITVLSLFDETYPACLRTIPVPPPVLFMRGSYESADGEAVGIVGARDASPRGIQLVERLVNEMAGRPLTVVSGMAIGIDTAAHSAALAAGLRTLAVLGSGIDRPYPARNRQLFEKIIEHGAVFSEHPPGTPPLPHHFPRRNRIISGLSRAVVIIEAGERSGSLITARYAGEQNRDLYAVPRTPTDRNAAGVNNLIKLGARIVTSAADIFADSFPGLKTAVPPAAAISLSDDERKIIAAITEEPVTIDDLCFVLDMGPASLANFLLTLELKGAIRELPGKRYVKQ